MNEAHKGYYRFPTIHDNLIIFTAEGDLWRVDTSGGMAQRLTTHHGLESHAALSPDGTAVAFSAQYEGPTEVYLMSVNGGRPLRLTYEDNTARVVGWTPDGKVLYSTTRYATLPNTQLATVDPQTQAHELLPLAQASDGVYMDDTLFFTRLPFQGSHTKRYKGGTAQNIWRFAASDDEATLLTADYTGTSKRPMAHNGRIYFASDRDGTMNLWSMLPDGGDAQQHTQHSGWDVKMPSLHNGRIVYQLGADLYLYDCASDETHLLVITLPSDFEQTRRRWVHYPMHYLDAWFLSPTGDRVALTARGKVFVVPVENGRLVEVTRDSSARYRAAQFLPDGQTLLAMSDRSGELEYYTLPANGIGDEVQITNDGAAFRYSGAVSPNGRWLAYADRDQKLWLVDLAAKETALLAESDMEAFWGLSWSPDSNWLAFVQMADNQHVQIKLYSLADGTITAVTSDRTDSYSPAWSPDGQWLYFLSDRHFQSLVDSPWGPRQPDPYLDRTTGIYMLGLQKGQRSPFRIDDELVNAPKEPSPPAEEQAVQKDEVETDAVETAVAVDEPSETNTNESATKTEEKEPPPIEIDFDGLAQRIWEVPVEPGNYRRLMVNDKALFYEDSTTDGKRKRRLMGLVIDNSPENKPERLLYDTQSYELARDGKTLLAKHRHSFYAFPADGKAPKPSDKKQVNLANWVFAVDLQQEWRQLFLEAWRLERDYFYDRNLHGIDWQGLLERHLPLVDRVTDRDELNDLLAQLVGELAALHTYVQAGDQRTGSDRIYAASLGATWTRDEAAGGYRLTHIYQTEPDYPERRSPAAHPEVALQVGDVITAVNGVSTLSMPHAALLLQNQAGEQVRLAVDSNGVSRDTIIYPITVSAERELRYDAWTYTRRLAVEEQGQGQIGYIHLRGMSGNNYAEWVRNYYPVFDRAGLIIDVRHNTGGNIDSWILGKLLRRAWFYWQPRVGKPSWNMQYAFRGHMVVLVNEETASDGEAFADGFRRLGLGQVIGTRTWGGEIWLSRNNWLVDKGIATAAQTGVYSANGEWLIEGHGVEPDIVVDNLPHATFQGQDAQLETAVDHLLSLIAASPNPVPPPPPHPDKSFRYG